MIFQMPPLCLRVLNAGFRRTVFQGFSSRISTRFICRNYHKVSLQKPFHWTSVSTSPPTLKCDVGPFYAHSSNSARVIKQNNVLTCFVKRRLESLLALKNIAVIYVIILILVANGQIYRKESAGFDAFACKHSVTLFLQGASKHFLQNRGVKSL